MVVYRDRSYSNLPAPYSNDGVTLRPLLAPGIPTITGHYPGAPEGRSYAGTAMLGDVKKKIYLFNMQAYAQAAGKSYEYNFVIFMDGQVWEYAGDYLAAHSAGENAVSYGVQFVNGQDDLCTDAQVEAFRWLRDVHLIGRGRLSPTCLTVPHRDMPGANTSCPGDRAIMPRLGELREPYIPLPPLEDDDMLTYIAQIPDGRFLLVGTSVRVLSRFELDRPPFVGQPVTVIPPTDDGAGDYRAYWLTQAANEYEQRVGAA